METYRFSAKKAIDACHDQLLINSGDKPLKLNKHVLLTGETM
jgi:hypothetical protein